MTLNQKLANARKNPEFARAFGECSHVLRELFVQQLLTLVEEDEGKDTFTTGQSVYKDLIRFSDEMVALPAREFPRTSSPLQPLKRPAGS